jgi:nicotinamidase-related amidase
VAALVATANEITRVAAANGVKVVYVGNEFPRSQWLRNFARRNAALAGSRGGELDPRVQRVSSTYVSKAEGDAFSNPALGAFLRASGAEDLIVLGVFAGACVRATTRRAMREGYRVTLVREAVGAGSDRARDRALANLAKAGARVKSGTEVLTELAEAR